MQANEFLEFRLVGGTALSLHLGHRMSVDFDAIESYLSNSFNFVSGNSSNILLGFNST